MRELRHLDSARFNPYDPLHPASRANRRRSSQAAEGVRRLGGNGQMTEPEGTSERRRVIAGLVAGLLHLVGCGGGGSGATAPQPPSPPPPPPPAPIDVSVTPAAASVQTSGRQTFTATVTNTTNKAVTWQVNGITGGNTSVGTISTTGVYTAPATVPSPAKVTVTAVSVADPTRSGSARVTVTAPPPSTSWLWGVTTDDSTVQTASQVSAVAAF